MTGIVKWFDQDKGFGFITTEEGQDVFVHHSAILGQKGRRNLTEQQRVEFEIEQGDRGPKAVNVHSLDGVNTLCPSHKSEIGNRKS